MVSLIKMNMNFHISSRLPPLFPPEVSVLNFRNLNSTLTFKIIISAISQAAKGYDCAFCDKRTKIGTLVVICYMLYVIYIYMSISIKPGTHRYRNGNRPPS